MSKIAFDARMLYSSTGRYMERLLYYLQEVDTVNTYYVLLKPKDIEQWKTTNKNFKKIACPYGEFTIAEQVGFLRQLHKLQPDLVHFPMVQQPILYRGKVVTTMQDLTAVRFGNPSKNWLIFTFKQTVYKWVNHIVAHRSDELITPSEFVKDDVAKYARVNSRKITVTYEAADKITDKPELVPGLEEVSFIMYVGRPQPHKNLYRLLAAYAELKKSRPDLRLVLVGKKDALYQRIERWIEDNSIEDVIFTGWVSEGQLRWLYEHCAAYIFPSLSEGFGLPPLEAMSHGAPVISSNATCLPEIYGDAAYYFDPLDVDDIASKINSVLSSKKLRVRLIEAGYEQIKKYSWAKMAKETLAVYKKVLGEN